MTPITYQELEFAFHWSSSAGVDENRALINILTGEVHQTSEYGDCDEELPEDIEDHTKYIPVPHKNELDLGRGLVFDFVRRKAPQIADVVHEYFSHRGAYAKFKALLERTGLLDSWYEFESEATRTALVEWAEDSGFKVVMA